MKFIPKEHDCVDVGNYQYLVRKATDTISKKTGADMITIELDIYQGGKRVQGVYDYLLESMMFKLRHFCQTCEPNLVEKFAKGELTASDCEGKTGWCKIKIDENMGYPKNAIADYIDKPELEKDEDIPF